MSDLAIDPGALDRRLALEAPAETPDGAGGVVRTYQEVATLWASVEPVAARGEVVAMQSGQTITHRILIRRRADITARHRLRDGAKVFRIVALRERDRRWLEIQAEERAA
jgi:SPP1 family predicted phage head-tail adaptor